MPPVPPVTTAPEQKPKIAAITGPKPNPNPETSTGNDVLEKQVTAKVPATTGTPVTDPAKKTEPAPKVATAPPQPPQSKKQPPAQQLAQRPIAPPPAVRPAPPAVDPVEAAKRARYFRSLEPTAPRSSLGVRVTKPTRTDSGRLYVVKAGETLTEIAKRELGDPRRYRAIWNVNRTRMEDPDHIWQGLRLRLP